MPRHLTFHPSRVALSLLVSGGLIYGCATAGDAPATVPGPLVDGGPMEPFDGGYGSPAESGVGADGGCLPGFVNLKGSCDYKCTPGPLAPLDPIDPGYTDENCDGTDGVVASCLFVSNEGTDAPTGGSPTSPLKTIAYALGLGKTSGSSVCVAAETFTGMVTLVSGVNLYGGFDSKDPDFAFRRGMATPSILTNPGTVVLSQTIDADTMVEGFTIHATAAEANADGAGVYGVRHVGGAAKLILRYNAITADAAHAGAPGTVGTDGLHGTNGVAGTNAESHQGFISPQGGETGPGPTVSAMCNAPSGGAGGQGGWDQSGGATGGGGSGGAGGGGGGSGNSTCGFSGGGGGGMGGTSSQAGTAGLPGGVPPQLNGLSADALYVPGLGGTGLAGGAGNAGGGGGGGGGGTNGGFCYGDRGASGGSGGTGGCGGTAGTGGQGGGASIAVSIKSGQAIVGQNVLVSSAGGIGGAGKHGGSGGIPGVGLSGGGSADDGAGGGSGGNGTTGGAGGAGAGGAGGPSACIAVATIVTLDQTPTNTCTVPPTGAAGGVGGVASNGGPVGVSKALLPLP